MRYGIHWTARVNEAGELGKIGRTAERLGYSSFGLPDHLITSRPLIDPFIGLTAVAETTKDIKLSTMVIMAGLRRSVQLVREVASLQSASGGRLELGLGAGWVPQERAILERWTGKGPLARVKEDVEMLECAFGESSAGSQVVGCSEPDHALAKTIAGTVERPTIMIAAGGLKMLGLAATHSNIAMLTVPVPQRLDGDKPSFDLLAQQIDHLREESPGGMPLVQFQIREYAPGVGSPSGDLWSLRGSATDIRERLDRLEDTGVGYISLCTSNIQTMERFANDIF